MTSTTLVQNEIERFLRSQEPEVLCITGEWGVGKTYNWQSKLEQLRARREVGLARYSYVSLFGINSLDALKQSIFENMEFVLPEGQSGFDRIVSGANRGFQQSKKLTSAVSAIPMVGDALAKLTQPFVFTSIRNQIVCIDDLERRGKDFSVKDVFGLISYLREQKGCKVVLLLNEDKLGSDPQAAMDFRDYFEKVVDAKVVFAPTPEEAAAIAFPGKDRLSQIIAEYSVKLGVKNIRVLKKIERLIGIVLPAVEGLGGDIERQVVHSLVIFGWSQFDAGAKPPPFSFLRRSSLSRYMDRQDAKDIDKEEERWDVITESYGFSHMDDFDLALMSFVESSVLNFDEIRNEAIKQHAANEQRKRAGSFENAFRPLHDSFGSNEDEVCSAMVAGIKENFDVINLVNVDEVVGVLNRLDRQDIVNELIDFVAAKAVDDFWINDDPFRRKVTNERLSAIVEAHKKAAEPVLDFERDLVAVAQNRDDELISQLAAQPVKRFVDLFESKTGEDLKRLILSALDSRRISNATPEQQEIVRKAEAALLEIGQKSRLNAIRVQKYGVTVPVEE